MSELYTQSLANLKRYWGFSSFLHGQDVVINSILNGQDTVVLFPTGGGKSLCYQVPATVLGGLTVVVSPLVALMQDQVSQLKSVGISATFVNSTLNYAEIEQRVVNARNGMYQLLYCSPERLKTPLWQNDLQNLPIKLIAIDEAHCISEWGHDFRPSYREIRESFEPIADKVRWMALTATATPEVQDDIIKNLGFKKPNIISNGYDRPNLKWWVIKEEQKEKRLLEIIKKARGSGLVYTGTRKTCDSLAKLIQKTNVIARSYHAGLTSEQRKRIQEEWIKGKVQVVVATNAFGMGIDKSDCRYVIHYDIPYSMEAYYQEAGRAGRDGKESYPILLVSKSDFANTRNNIEQSYPKQEELWSIYSTICDDWELAEGSEMTEPKKIIVENLINRNKHSKRKQLAGIKLLNQLGVIELQEYRKARMGVKMLVSRAGFHDLLSSIKNMEKKEFIDRIVRLYGPECFNKMCYKETEYLQKKLGVESNSLIKGLNVLANEYILEYDSITDQPVAMLTYARSANFPYSKKQLEAHRNSIIRKLDSVFGYIDTIGCRNAYIRHYFGDTDVPSKCGFCDNCLKKNKKKDDFSEDNIKLICCFLEKSTGNFQAISRATRITPQVLKPLLAWLIKEDKLQTRIGNNGIEYLLTNQV